MLPGWTAFLHGGKQRITEFFISFFSVYLCASSAYLRVPFWLWLRYLMNYANFIAL